MWQSKSLYVSFYKCIVFNFLNYFNYFNFLIFYNQLQN